MKLGTKTRPLKTRSASRRAGFTLAEVLAALVFMAIVIPVAVEGVRIASLAGELAQRKTLALRVAEKMLNETILTSQGNLAVRNGTVQQGAIQFRWTVRNELWKKDAMRQVTSEVTFAAQNQDYSVRLTTLVVP